ncbi:MAG: AMP-binding protein [Actinobacteria bacterium]|nr:AMP-binding protein [Actinomycetota bacterium]
MIDATGLPDLIDMRVAATPDDVMLVDQDERTITFADFRDLVERAAAGLAALDLGDGDVVSWQLPTWIESVVLVGALSRLGAVQNPILPIYRKREVAFVCKQARAKLLIVPTEWRGFDFKALADDVAGEVDGLGVLTADKQLPEGDPSTLPPSPSTDTDPVRWLFYTSGTTADPKGAQHTDATIMATAIAMNERIGLRADDRSGLVFPFTHIGGITWMFSTLIEGCTTILAESFDPVETPKVLQRERVTLAGSGTAFHMAYLNAQRATPDTPLFPHVRLFPGGGAPKPPQLHYDLKKEMGGVGIVSGYGLTEAPIIAMASHDDSDKVLADTEGRATRGVQLRAVTLDGKATGIDEEGEIRAKAPQMMKGYLDPSLDADAFDEDGWFRTGDLGVIDADGNVKITGRLKDIIIRKGENISAKEVEDLLFTHDKIADVAVIGLPDPASGERACAVVVLANPEAKVSLVDIRNFLTDKGLMVQKVPEQVEYIATLPRNPTGKVLKHELRSQFS